MRTINVMNMKCGGCANTVNRELNNMGIIDIHISFSDNDSFSSRKISFNGDYNSVRSKLISLGYPEVGSEEAKNLLIKAKSFVSCAIGKLVKNNLR